MEELRFVRRDDQSLIAADEAGVEYRFVVDDRVLAELRHLSRREREAPRVSPREIQSLVRAGKSRAEIIALTGADETDIERYEEPVLAERTFILSSAQAVAVRKSPEEGSEQPFGTVIAERLIGLQATGIEWRAWRDEELGWMVGVDFTSHDVDHHAVWSFEHRKGVLAPLSPDAVSLSRQGDVGDRLIPKLRAVDVGEPRDRFDSGAFAPTDLPAERGEGTPTAPTGAEAAFAARHPSTGSIPIIDPNAEFARRREIDQRAINTPEPEVPDLGQTADLLDALRKRRGERDADAGSGPRPVQVESHGMIPPPPGVANDRAAQAPDDQDGPAAENSPLETPGEADRPRRGRGRTAIPSWDDILFGTRSDEDPA